MSSFRKPLKKYLRLFTLFTILITPYSVGAETPVFKTELKEHLFHPSELIIPAGVKVKILVINQDASPEEFESYALNREKIVMGHQKITIFIGPLSPGEYPFFGEFHPNTAQGKIIVK